MSFETSENAEQRAREANPELDAALTRVAAESKKYLDPVVDYFAPLEEEIRTMPIASRFRRDQAPNHIFAPGGEEGVLPHLKGLSEAEYKRAQLAVDLSLLRSQALAVIGGIQALVMDIEATKTEG